MQDDCGERQQGGGIKQHLHHKGQACPGIYRDHNLGSRAKESRLVISANKKPGLFPFLSPMKAETAKTSANAKQIEK